MVSLTMTRSSGDATELSMTAVASKAPGTGTGSVLTVPENLTVAELDPVRNDFLNFI
jgi:hypothetical protein